MITDVIAITSIIVSGIMGACLKFNRTSRKIYSLVSAMGLSLLIFNLYQAHVHDVAWLSNIDQVLTQMGPIRNFALFFFLLFISLLLSLALYPFYKLIELAIASISKPTSIMCGIVFGLINSLIFVFVVLQVCGLMQINIETRIFKDFITIVNV